MTRRRGGVFGLLVLVVVTSSCVLRGPSDIRHDVEAATGAEYEREFAITMGRVSLAVAKLGMKLGRKHAPEDMPDVSLKGVRKVQVGVYQVREGTWDLERPGFDPGALNEWEPVVRIHEDGETVHVLTRTEDSRLRGMLVVVSEADELVIVRMRGRLDGLVEDAVRFGLRQAGREQHGEAALEQLQPSRTLEAGPCGPLVSSRR